MLAVPLLRTTLLPRTIPLEAALRRPSPLLLPRDCLLPRTLRLLLLPGLLGTLCLLLLRLDPLLLLRLLGTLLRLRLLGPLRLLSPLRLLGLLPLLGLLGLLPLLGLLDPLLLLRLLSSLLLLCGWRCSLLSLTVLRFGLPPLIILLVLLRVRWGQGSKKQKQGSGTCNSNELHGNHPPLNSLLGMQADDQSALTMFQRLCGLRLGPGLVHRPIRVVGRRVDRVQL
jgi:hypothetical protein